MNDPRREPVQALLDLVFYAPIGAFFHGPDVVSELAERGRGQVANAKVLGEVAFERGRQEFGEVAETVQQHLSDVLVAAARAAGAPMAGADDATAAEPAEPQSTSTESPANDDAAVEAAGAGLRVVRPDSVPASDLPIPDYDNLSASQVVPRLDDLADDELDAVRDYEAAHRGRMTILSRIAQLRAS